MLWTLFEISANLFQAWIMVYFLKPSPENRKKGILADYVFIGIITVYSSINLFFNISLNSMLIFILPLLYSLCVSNAEWYISLFWSIILALLFSSTAGASIQLFLSIADTSFEYALLQTPMRLLFVLWGNIALFVVLTSAKKLHNQGHQLGFHAASAFLLINISLLVIEEVLYYLQCVQSEYKTAYTLGYAGVLTCSLLTMHLFRALSERFFRESQLQAAMSIQAAEAKHQSEFTAMYNDFVRRQHDFKHQLEILESLVKQNDNAAAHTYLTEYQSSLPASQTFITGCAAVVALLTAKHYSMLANNIEFHFSAYPLASLPIATTDFCSILGNLLDNAIEGIQLMPVRPDKAYIRLSLARSWDMFFIHCENPCDPVTLNYRNGHFSSTKKKTKPRIHGIGLHSTTQIVENAEGRAEYYADGSIFHAKCILPHVGNN